MKKVLFILCGFWLCACESDPARKVGESNGVSTHQTQTKKQELHKDVLKKNEPVGVAEPALYCIDTGSDLNGSNNLYNRLALKVAGISADRDFSENLFYKGYVGTVENGWANLSKNSLSKIPDWVTQNVDPKVGRFDAVFYPFGGPDIAYALTFFPNASKYILVGLERFGNFRQINKHLQNTNAIPQLQKAMDSFFKRGYFITSEMLRDFSNDVLKGALPVILLQFAKLNCEIRDITYLSINENGQLVAYNNDLASCARIRFLHNGKEKEVYYFRMDLHDSNPKSKWLMKFVDSFDFCTFVKSASYILHDYTFAEMRNFVMQKSQFILQDDTGVPAAFFGEEWNKYPFGKYENPTLEYFKGYKQPKLEELHAKSAYVEIPFKIGYGYNLARPNLLLAVPKMDRSKYGKAVMSDITEAKAAVNEQSECIECGQEATIE